MMALQEPTWKQLGNIFALFFISSSTLLPGKQMWMAAILDHKERDDILSEREGASSGSWGINGAEPPH